MIIGATSDVVCTASSASASISSKRAHSLSSCTAWCRMLLVVGTCFSLRYYSSNVIVGVHSFQQLAACTTKISTARRIFGANLHRHTLHHHYHHRRAFFLTLQKSASNKPTTITGLSLSSKAAATTTSSSAFIPSSINSTMTAAATQSATNGGHHAPALQQPKEARAKRISFFQNNNNDNNTTSNNILQACGERIRNGDLVAFPTETVYGLGCNALNAEACKKVFLAKERPLTDPLIVHVNHPHEAYSLWHATSSISSSYSYINKQQQDGGNLDDPQQQQLQQECLLLERRILETLCLEFWPGPLTLVARAATCADSSDNNNNNNGTVVPPPSILMAGTGFVACRSPCHPIARCLIQAARVPIAAPSANKFGHVSPTTAQHVWDDLQYENVWIVEDDDNTSGGESMIQQQLQEIDKQNCDIGVESTVAKLEVEVTTTTPRSTSSSSSTSTAHLTATLRVLRQGAIAAQELDACLQQALSDGLLNRPADGKNSKHHDDNDDDDSSPFPFIQLQILTQHKNTTVDDHVATVAPGQTIRHYSPRIPSFVLSHECIQQESSAPINNTSMLLLQQAVLVDFGETMVHWKNVALAYRDLSDVGDSAQAARCVFETLRWAEQVSNAKRIFFPSLSTTTTTTAMKIAAAATAGTNHEMKKDNKQQDDALLLAVEDRLTRAASGVILDRLEDANV